MYCPFYLVLIIRRVEDKGFCVQYEVNAEDIDIDNSSALLDCLVGDNWRQSVSALYVIANSLEGGPRVRHAWNFELGV